MKRYLAIEREYGSGGMEIALKLAEELQIPCYGHEILENAARRIEITVQDLQAYEEHACTSVLYSVAMMGRALTTDPDQMLRDGHWVIAEQRAIRELAARGPGIFLGHGAAQALRDEPGLLRVFVRAPIDARRRRLTGSYGIPERDADSAIRRYDQTRSSYYSVNTATDWHSRENYDVILDSSVLGIRGCVEMLRSLMG